jgi:hypothetical protein
MAVRRAGAQCSSFLRVSMSWVRANVLVHVGQHRADKPDHGGVVGKIPTTRARRLISLFMRKTRRPCRCGYWAPGPAGCGRSAARQRCCAAPASATSGDRRGARHLGLDGQRESRRAAPGSRTGVTCGKLVRSVGRIHSDHIDVCGAELAGDVVQKDGHRLERKHQGVGSSIQVSEGRIRA